MEPKKVMHSPVAASEPQPVQATDLRTPPDVLPLAASNLASEFLLARPASDSTSRIDTSPMRWQVF